MLLTIVIVVVVAAVVLYALNPQALSRLFGAGRAQVGKVGRAAENADPLAMYQQQLDDAAVTLRQQLEALKLANTQLESIQRQVDDGEKEKTRLETRIKSVMEKGDPNQSAKRYALELASVEKHLAENRQQLEQQQVACESFSRQVDMNRQKMRDAKDTAQRKGVELRQSEAQKVAAEQFAQLSGGDLFDGMSTAMQKLQEKIDANRASARVDNDQCSDTLAEMKDAEDDRNAQADEILARFKKPETT